MELSAIHWSYKFPSAPPLPACNGPTTLTEEEQVQLHAGAHDGMQEPVMAPGTQNVPQIGRWQLAPIQDEM